MSKILQLSAGIFCALLLGSVTLATEPQSNTHWTPLSTTNSVQKQQKISTLSPLRTLSSRQSQKLQVERAVQLDRQNTNRSERTVNVTEGDRLLQSGRWLEAKKYFEKALRSDPDNAFLRTRFAEARRRYEIDGRYQDASFSTLTRSSSLDDQLTVFDEVFLDVDIYHVDRPSYEDLFDLGLSGISEALSEDSFYTQNGLDLGLKKQAQTLFDALKQTSQEWSLDTEDDVRRSVLWLAKQMRRKIGVSESAIISEFLCSAICSLDAYSTPLTPTQVEDVFSMIDGRFVGLGVELKTDQPTIIVRVIPNSPAQESGLTVGDELIQIDGRSTAKLTGTEIGELLQGYEGEKATLVVKSPDGSSRKVVAIRRPIEVPSVEDVHILDSPGSVGYLKISCFQKTTADELKDAIDTLSQKNAQSIVVDLRQNPGGLLQEAVNVSDVFLDSGTIVQTRGRSGSHVFTARKTRTCSLPLVLVVDSNSASAAEIFAGAMQENGRAIVVGTQSYGKGTVQAIVQLNETTQGPKPIAGLRLTTEKFYSPKGRAYGGVGILPDVDISDELLNKQVHSDVSEAYAENVVDSIAPELPTGVNVSSETRVQYKVAKPVSEVEEDPFLRTAVREANKQIFHRRAPSRKTVKDKI